MKRFLPTAAVVALALTTAHVPAATAAAASSLTPAQTEELVTSYARLTADFYKQVDRQAALDAARTSMLTYLEKQGKVVKPALPALHASNDELTNVRALEREVELAVATYGGKLATVDKLSPSTQITYSAIDGLLSSVKDKYTVFLSPKEYAALNEGLDGTSFGGIGVTYDLDEKTKSLHVQNVIIGGPSDKAGLQPDDAITEIDGKPVAQIIAGAATETNDDKRYVLETKAISTALRGQPGTRVRLTIARGKGAGQPVTITRETIKAPSVVSRMLPNNVGYVQLSVFGATTGQELNAALRRLDGEGAKAYVLDLRENGGGYLNAAVDVSSKFISSGPIVTVKQRQGTDTEYDAENTAIAPRPLAVLVNDHTASASEITAGAIQDSGVGTLIGEKTFGKGVVQTIFPMRDGSAVKITTARYFTPKGRDINTVGIEPEIKVAYPTREQARANNVRFSDPKSDPQLIAALQFLNNKVAQDAPPIR